MPRPIDRSRHRAAQRIDFVGQVALADPADRRVAAHLPERFDVLRNEQRARARARGGQRGFRAGVSAANYDYVEVLHYGYSPGGQKVRRPGRAF